MMMRILGASMFLRSYRVGIARACCAQFHVSAGYLVENAVGGKGSSLLLPTYRFSFPNTFWGCQNLSSQTGPNIDGHSELENSRSDKFSKGEVDAVDLLLPGLEYTPEVQDSVQLTTTEENELGLLEIDDDGDGDGNSIQKNFDSALTKAVADASRHSFTSVLDKWVDQGNALERTEIVSTVMCLMKKRLYATALQFFEWLDENKRFNFLERDHAIYLNLIAKVHNVYKAERYMKRIPESHRGEIVYQTLLANYVSAFNLKKAAEVFKKMIDLGFPLTAFSCNQLLLLYKNVDKRKMANVLALMKKENIKPTIFTYKLLIDFKGRVNDINGMEQIIESMKSNGISPVIDIQAMIAGHYISEGFNEKAEAVLKEIEGADIKKKRMACGILLPLYAAIGKAADVERLWKVCEVDLSLDECLAAMKAWGKLGNVENAEAVFEHMVKTWNKNTKLSSKCYSLLLQIYADHKLLIKGKALVKRMTDDGYKTSAATWDALAWLYLNIGELEKADALLQRESEKNHVRPMFTTYQAMLNAYAERGDVHNAERIFDKMRMGGYIGRMTMYRTLLIAYICSKTPAYGFLDRMKADNVYPKGRMVTMLQTNDPFRKSWVSEVLS